MGFWLLLAGTRSVVLREPASTLRYLSAHAAVPLLREYRILRLVLLHLLLVCAAAVVASAWVLILLRLQRLSLLLMWQGACVAFDTVVAALRLPITSVALTMDHTPAIAETTYCD